jgi:hypothetical protein
VDFKVRFEAEEGFSFFFLCVVDEWLWKIEEECVGEEWRRLDGAVARGLLDLRCREEEF